MNDPISTLDVALGAASTGAGIGLTLKGWPLLLKLFRNGEGGTVCRAAEIGTQFEHVTGKLDSIATELTKAVTLLGVVVDRLK